MNKGLRQPALGGVKAKSESERDIKDFRELKVWQTGMELFEEVLKDVESFPKTEVAKIIANQIMRSVSSITANIAEGYGRRKGKEFEHYLYIARGSAKKAESGTVLINRN